MRLNKSDKKKESIFLSVHTESLIWSFPLPVSEVPAASSFCQQTPSLIVSVSQHSTGEADRKAEKHSDAHTSIQPGGGSNSDRSEPIDWLKRRERERERRGDM